MLPPFIIEQIRKREEEEARPQIRPAIELPLPPVMPRRVRESDDEGTRGVIVIDL
ncbi:MAG: hypothetical protein J0L92_33610 [Deltaproteobacteria bacterium]|nr:hypothetical protein [Deltaproteobacteria bacterium]